MELAVGTLLQGGKYRIVKTLGRGGFGITYLAEQVNLHRMVCIKEFFPKDYFKRDDNNSSISLLSASFRENMSRFKAKFVKEAQTIADLEHPNIVGVKDVFEENNTAYYIMDYVEGESLSEMVKRCGAMGERDAVAYIKQVASALEYIHSKQIMHLDVKPANIMVRRDDNSAILIDFGLSKHYDATSGEATSTTPVGVSHGYAPMEQYQDGGVRSFAPETDIYSLGATLYFLVTGETPPPSVDIAERGLDMPVGLAQNISNVILCSMHYWRKDRPHSISEFIALLDGTMTPVVVNMRRTAGGSLSKSTSSDDTRYNNTKGVDPNEKSTKRRRRLWWLCLAVLAIIGVGLLFTKQDNTNSADATSVAPIAEDSSDIVIDDYEPTGPLAPGNEMWYTTSDNQPLESVEHIKPNVVAHTYSDGKGVIRFDHEVTCFHGYMLGEDRITSITLPESLTTISGFGGLNITNIALPKGVTTIEEGAFIDCTSLKSISIPNKVTTIEDNVFNCCSSLESVTIPNSVTTIGDRAFGNCSSLDSISIPRSVTTIGVMAFAGCSSLRSVTIPRGVTTIRDKAFAECFNLESITIPSSVESIGDHVFGGCCNLREIKGEYATADGRGLVMRDTLIRVAAAGLERYVVPKNVKVIDIGALWGCDSLQEVQLHDDVTHIGEAAFCVCDSLAGITIPNSVTMIGSAAFYGCKALSTVMIGSGVTTIGDEAFLCCISLKEVTIPACVNMIGNRAFYITGLDSIYCEATTPPTLGGEVFYTGLDGFKGNIYVPTEAVEAYKKADGWKEYADYIVAHDF